MILAANDENIARAADILRGGGLAAFPTETVYGLGADAFNSKALARVFAVKNRPRFDPLIVHIALLDTLNTICNLEKLSKTARQNLKTLASNFWPGPLTIILPKNHCVPGIATAGLDTVAVRFPSHGVALKLIASSTGAIAAPSANPFGRLSPTRAEHVALHLEDKIDVILDGGPCGVGVESTVLDLCAPTPRILRHGGLCAEELQKVCVVETASQIPSEKSPGQLPSHYAPKTELIIFEQGAEPPLEAVTGQETAVIYFSRGGRQDSRQSAAAGKKQFFLSETGSTAEAAARLFELLHELDSQGLRRVYAEKAPESGLGMAINDRLNRASYK